MSTTTSKLDVEEGDRLREEGNRLFKLQNYTEAVKKYDEALKLNGLDDLSYTNKAMILTNLKQYGEAERTARIGYVLNPKNVKGFYRAAECAFFSGHRRRSLMYVLVGLQFNQDHPDLLKIGNRLKESDIDVKEFMNKQSVDMKKEIKEEYEFILRIKAHMEKNTFDRRNAIIMDELASEGMMREEYDVDEEEYEEEKIIEPRPEPSQGTPKKAAKKQQASGKKETIKMYNKGCSEGTRLYLDGAAKMAANEYSEALAVLKKTGAKTLSIQVQSVVILKYAYGIACIETAETEYILRGLESLDDIITNHTENRYPFVYFGLAKGYMKFNRFRKALGPIEKGLDMVTKKFAFDAVPWPGVTTIKIIEETKSSVLEVKLRSLHEVCMNPPSSAGVCRSDICDNKYPFDELKREIYFSDPDYKGFYEISCCSQCHIQYHLNCWKVLKTSRDKKTDKDMYGGRCATPDCDGFICEVKIFGLDGSETVVDKPSAVEEPPTKQKRTTKLEKKAEQKLKKKSRRDDKDIPSSSAKEMASSESCSKEEEGSIDSSKDVKVSVPVKKVRKERIEDARSRSTSESKSRTAPLPIDIDDSKIKVLKRDDESAEAKGSKKSKEVKKKKTEKQSLSVEEFLATKPAPAQPTDPKILSARRYINHQANVTEADDTVFSKVPVEKYTQWSDSNEVVESLSANATAVSLISFFWDLVASQGPTESDTGVLLDVMKQLPTDSQEIVADAGGLSMFLLTNKRFFGVDGLVCARKDIEKCGEMVLSLLKEMIGICSPSSDQREPDFPSLEEMNPRQNDEESESESEEEYEEYDVELDEYMDSLMYRQQNKECELDGNDDDHVNRLVMEVAKQCKEGLVEEYDFERHRTHGRVAQFDDSSDHENEIHYTKTSEDIEIQTDLAQSDVEGLYEKIQDLEENLKRQLDNKAKLQNKNMAKIAELEKKLSEQEEKTAEVESARKKALSHLEEEKKKLNAEKKRCMEEAKKHQKDAEKSRADAQASDDRREKAEQNLRDATVQLDIVRNRAVAAEENVETLQTSLDKAHNKMQDMCHFHLDTLRNICKTEVERVRKECETNLTCLKQADAFTSSGTIPSRAEIDAAVKDWMDVFGNLTSINRDFEAKLVEWKEAVNRGEHLVSMNLTIPAFNITAPMPLNPKFPIEKQIQTNIVQSHPASGILSQLLQQYPQISQQMPPPPPVSSLLPPSLPASLGPMPFPLTNGVSSLESIESKLMAGPQQTEPKPREQESIATPPQYDEEEEEDPRGAAAAVDSDSSSRSSTPSHGKMSLSNAVNAAAAAAGFGPDDTKLFVGKIPLHVSEEELKKLFSKYVPVLNVSLRVSGYKVNFAFIALRSSADRDYVLSKGPFRVGRYELNVEAKLPKELQMPPPGGAQLERAGSKLRFENKKEEDNPGQDKTFCHPLPKVMAKPAPAAPKQHSSSPVETAAMDVIKSKNSASKVEILLQRIQNRMPGHRREELIQYLVQVREASRNNSLAGMTEEMIVQEIQKLVKNKKSGGGILGLDDIPVPQSAWGGKKPGSDQINFKDAEDECAICYEKIQRKTENALSCGHTFHRNCVERWVKEQSTCPKCRKHVLLPDEFPAL